MGPLKKTLTCVWRGGGGGGGGGGAGARGRGRRPRTRGSAPGGGRPGEAPPAPARHGQAEGRPPDAGRPPARGGGGRGGVVVAPAAAPGGLLGLEPAPVEFPPAVTVPAGNRGGRGRGRSPNPPGGGGRGCTAHAPADAIRRSDHKRCWHSGCETLSSFGLPAHHWASGRGGPVARRSQATGRGEREGRAVRAPGLRGASLLGASRREAPVVRRSPATARGQPEASGDRLREGRPPQHHVLHHRQRHVRAGRGGRCLLSGR